MNLWVKRIALGLMAAVALFLFACLDEENILGFENQNRKLNVSYIEIPLKSSVLLFDSLRTSNYQVDAIKRLLVGTYEDPIFGTIKSEAYSQFRPANVLKSKEDGAIYDSVTLQLRFDLYSYGAATASFERYQIHELKERMSFRNGNDYYTTTPVLYDPFVLGTVSALVNPSLFKAEVEDETTADTTITVKLKLDNSLGRRLFTNWNTANEDFYDPEQFTKIFNGLAIVGTNNSKIVGFSTGDSSKITLHYHTLTDTLKFDYVFSLLPSSSKIDRDFSNTPLQGIQPYQSFNPSGSDKLYVQSGAPLGIKLDFSKFIEFSDTIENLVINSAELMIDGIDDPQNFDPPKSLFLQVLNDQNRLKQLAETGDEKYSSQRFNDILNLRLFNDQVLTLTTGNNDLSTFSINKNNVFSVLADDQRNFAQLSFNKNSNSYKGFITLFMQELGTKQEGKTQFPNYILYPGNPLASKSLNRMSFDKSKLKLKVYYTTPSNNQ